MGDRGLEIAEKILSNAREAAFVLWLLFFATCTNCQRLGRMERDLEDAIELIAPEKPAVIGATEEGGPSE